MKGPQPIEVPSYFTPEWYLGEKEQGKTDMELADELFVSYGLLAKWKKKVGCQAGAARKFCGRKASPSNRMKKAWEMRNGGCSYLQISEELNITIRAARDYVSKIRRQVV